MSVLSLADYRKDKKKKYFEQVRRQLNDLLLAYINDNFRLTFSMVNDHHQAQCFENQENSWDYEDFREMVKDALTESFGMEIMNIVRAQHWFDPTWLSEDEVMERCVTIFVLGETYAANC